MPLPPRPRTAPRSPAYPRLVGIAVAVGSLAGACKDDPSPAGDIVGPYQCALEAGTDAATDSGTVDAGTDAASATQPHAAPSAPRLPAQRSRDGGRDPHIDGATAFSFDRGY